MRQIVLDTETTGLNPKLGDRIIEIGCVELVKAGFDTLVEACRLLSARGVEFRCRISGTGPLLEPLQRQVQAAGLASRVDLPGWAAAEALVDEMSRAVAFSMPSRIARGGDRYGIPNVVLEAMAAGLPVVATAVSGLAEAVVHGKTGLLVDPDQPEALARALELLLLDLLGQGVGDRLGDQCLAAAGRAVQQHALGWLELVLLEQLAVQERQLDGVADRLDLVLETTDLAVVDVRDLFEDQLLDLGLRDLLVHVSGAGLEQQLVTGPQGDVEQLRREPHHALLVGLRDHQRPLAVGDDGQIVVDKSKKFQQERGEWTNPESFITV